jgi:dihydroorotate dehydrogenase electron transfer subunit
MREKCRIVENDWIAPGVFETVLSAPRIAETARPGQFLSVYVPGGAMLLPRPFSVSDVRGANVSIIYKVKGRGTDSLSKLPEGSSVEILGPNGTGFFDYPGSITDLKRDQFEARRTTVFLIGGGLGIPPLLYAARAIKAARHGRAQIVAFLGYPADPWYSKQMRNHADKVVSSSDTPGRADITGTVIDALNYAAHGYLDDRSTGLAPALMCGPEPMMAAAAEWCSAHGLESRVSLEARMGCGYGVCRGCSRVFKTPSETSSGARKQYTDTQKTMKRICTHGPVFWGDEIIWRKA